MTKQDQLYSLLHSKPPASKEQIIKDLTCFLLKSDDWEFIILEDGVSQSAICGHVFVKGEQVYRCKTCSLDDTCVLCVDCFKASNHAGHDTSFSVSQGMSGFCDCGDKEAWKVDLHCGIHSEVKKTCNLGLPMNVQDHLKMCFAGVLDFILEVFESSPLELKIPTQDEILALKESEDTEFIGYLWNDEVHSFQEVIDQLVDGIECTDLQGKIIAEDVDENGRAEFMRSSDVKMLINSARVVAETGLAVSITTTLNAFREELAADLLSWLVKDVPKIFAFKLKLKIDGKSSEWTSLDVLAKTLLEAELICDRNRMRDVANDTKPEPNSLNVFMIQNISAITRDPIPDFSYSSLYTSRLHFLIHYDTKLWKMPRSQIMQLMINCFITLDEDSKKKLGLYFAYHYPELMNCTLFHDRETDFSISNYTVQLFTVPTISEFLVKHTKIVSSIFCIIKGFFLGDSIPEEFKPQSDFLGAYQLAANTTHSVFPRMNCESSIVRNRKYWHLFQDLRYVLSTDKVKTKLFKLHPEHMRDFLDMIVIFQGMQPQQRSTQIHVEYETDHWVHALNLALQLSLLVGQVADCFEAQRNYEEGLKYLVDAIHKTVFVLSTWCAIDHVKEKLYFNTQFNFPNNTESDFPFGFSLIRYGNKVHLLPDFKVSLQRVSLYFPLHCLLAELISKLPHIIKHVSDPSNVDDIWKAAFSEEALQGYQIEDYLSAYSPHLESIKKDNLLTLVFDYPLRVMVMLSQIRAGIWVRNGYMMRSQAQHFQEIMLREWYDNNLLLLQTAATILQPSLFLTSVVERFELRNWLDFGRPGNIDLAQQASINEDLLQLLIYILSERSKIMGISQADELKREIIHHLGSSTGLAYSELKKNIPDRLLDTNENLDRFDRILEEVSIFKFPENPTDQGIYLLKDDYYSQLDPWFWHLSKTERNSLEAILKRKLDEKLKRGVIELQIPHLIPFTSRSCHRHIVSLLNEELFIQIIFYSIWHTTKRFEDSGEESTPSDHVLSASIHLILLGISESKNPPLTISLDSFYRGFSSTRFNIKVAGEVRPTTCLELICWLVDRADEEEVKEHARALRFIISQIELYGVESALQTISGWRDKSRWSFGGTQKEFTETKHSGTETLTEKEKKKIAAKQRQAAIMAQFESAQKSFMANFGDELNYLDDDSAMEVSESYSTPPENRPDQRSVQFPSGPCIVCQEDASVADGRIYGCLGLVQTSYLEKQFRISACDKSLQTLADSCKKWDHERGSQETLTGIYSSSCGHLMHNSCFNTYIQSIEARQASQSTRNHPEDINHREFLCPLCKTFGNVLFPITEASYSQFVNWYGSEDISEGSRMKNLATKSEGLRDWWKLRSQKIQDIVSGKMLITPTINSSRVKDMPSSNEIIGSSISDFKDYISNIFMSRRPLGGASGLAQYQDLEAAFEENFIPGIEHACEQLGLSMLGIEPNYLVAYTLGCVEIASRGMKSDHKGGVSVEIVNCMNPQISSFMPVFVSAMQAYSRLCLQETEFCSVLNRESSELFTSLFSGLLPEINTVSIPGILDRDPFQVLTQIVQIIDLYSDASIANLFGWIRICWMLEITRIISSLALNLPKNDRKEKKGLLENMLIADIQSALHIDRSQWFQEEDLDNLITICETISVVFLRRTTLLCYAFFGMVPPSGKYGFGFESDNHEASFDTVSSEFKDLVTYLSLPNVKDLLCTPTNDKSIERILVDGWIDNCRDQLKWNYFPAPIKFKLLDLPHTYDELFEISRKYICPNCNQNPSDPALCLVCGTFVCSQSYCCLQDGAGECNQHARRPCWNISTDKEMCSASSACAERILPSTPISRCPW